MMEIPHWVEANSIEVAVLVIIVCALGLAYIYSRNHNRSAKDGPSGIYLPRNIDDIVSITDDLSDPARVRRIFNNVFFDKRTRESMIAYYRKKHRLNNDVDAMRYAIKDRENDERRWR
jgi:hypothetical protein